MRMHTLDSILYSHLPIFALGGASLIFSVELLELSKKPYFSIPTDKEFWAYAGLLLLAVLAGYEFYRRAKNKQPSKDKDSATTRTTNRKSKKKNK